jgi:hypothetical protein
MRGTCQQLGGWIDGQGNSVKIGVTQSHLFFSGHWRLRWSVIVIVSMTVIVVVVMVVIMLVVMVMIASCVVIVTGHRTLVRPGGMMAERRCCTLPIACQHMRVARTPTTPNVACDF